MQDGVTLTPFSEAKYLGTIVDHHLNYKRNTEKRAKRALYCTLYSYPPIGKSSCLKPLIIK